MFEQATVTYVKDVVGILSGAATLAGIIVGAILAWRRWGREAPQAARGDLSHKISQHLLGSSQRLVHVTLTVKNTGTITLRPKEVYTLIQQVDPLEGDFRQRLLGGKEPLGETLTEYDWPLISRRDYPVEADQIRIDSGESHVFDADFLLPSGIKAIFVYSLACLDPKDPQLGWDVTDLFAIDAERSGRGASRAYPLPRNTP